MIDHVPELKTPEVKIYKDRLPPIVPGQLAHGIDTSRYQQPMEALETLVNQGFTYTPSLYPNEFSFSFHVANQDQPQQIFDRDYYSLGDNNFPFLCLMRPEVSERLSYQDMISDEQLEAIIAGAKTHEARFEDDSLDWSKARTQLAEMGITFDDQQYGGRVDRVVNEFLYSVFVNRFYTKLNHDKSVNYLGVIPFLFSQQPDDFVEIGMGVRAYDLVASDSQPNQFQVVPYRLEIGDVQSLVLKDEVYKSNSEQINSLMSGQTQMPDIFVLPEETSKTRRFNWRSLIPSRANNQ